VPLLDVVDEARRSMEICNACRYCEGFCAVFPAMELRREFTGGDLNYLANLCHDCRGCFYACQYTAPHEFALNVPKALGELRASTYARYAWPRPLGAAFRRNGTIVALATTGSIALVLIGAALAQSPTALTRRVIGAGMFYAIIPERMMTAMAIVATAFAILALGIGVRRFWRDSGRNSAITAADIRVALRDLLTLRNLGGGASEVGCNDHDDAFSNERRIYHHALFYGFLLCLASTIVAAVYAHLLAQPAPYPLFSVPVVLGLAGGIGMLVGAVGLMRVKIAADVEPAARALRGGEYALLVQLLLASVTGLALLAFRETSAMGVLLAVHLGVILSFFVLMPYGKFVHGMYRSAALLRNAAERRSMRQRTGDSHL
jgi:citrate/tricarballylate utilization protein